jgi:hypothetical protein
LSPKQPMPHIARMSAAERKIVLQGSNTRLDAHNSMRDVPFIDRD